MISRIQRLFLLGLGCAFLASADEVTFSLSTTGSFGSGTPSDLTFTGIGSASVAGFTGTTVGGALSLTNLGTFSVKKPSQGADNYTSDTFTLNLMFFSPAGIAGQTIFDAQLTGTVNTQQGTVAIDFGPTQTFAFVNPEGSGGFDLSISDLTLTVPHDGTISVSKVLNGDINNAFDPAPVDTSSVPEPGSIVLVGSMVLWVARRTRRHPVR